VAEGQPREPVAWQPLPVGQPVAEQLPAGRLLELVAQTAEIPVATSAEPEIEARRVKAIPRAWPVLAERDLPVHLGFHL